jgi:uncharacterized protein
VPQTASADARTTYLLIDGENLDNTLGGILGRRPAPDERPRWNKVVEFAEELWAQPVKSLFFINASHGDLPMPFLQALTAMHLRPVLLRGPTDVKVVDVGIQRTLEAIVDRDGDVLLGSHDGDFLPQVDKLLDGRRRVGVLGFREFLNAGYGDRAGRGLQLCDLEDAIGVFTYQLPRMRVIDIDEFDPLAFL